MFASMTRWRKSALSLLLHAALLLENLIVPLPQVFGSAGDAAKNGEQTATIISVRKVLLTPYFLSRCPQLHFYMLYILLDTSDQSYCTEYETPVVDEVADVTSAIQQNIIVVVKGKSINIQVPKGHKLKAHVTTRSRC